MPKVALVTDSTASLPPEVAAKRGITVVPLQVVVGGHAFQEGVHEEATPALVAKALRERVQVSTSRPAPAVLLEAYRRAAAEGAEAVVSVHLSADMSATFESAALAAAQSPIPVEVVDSRQVGIGTGLAVLTAADMLEAGHTAAEAAAAARARAEAETSLFYVDTLEYLRRGGRVRTSSALLGSALAIKPLLQMVDGRIETVEKVRTSARALHRLAELAAAAAQEHPVEVAVAHLDNELRADALAEELGARLAANLEGRPIHVGEVGAVIGAHTGPGLVAVVVAPLLTRSGPRPVH